MLLNLRLLPRLLVGYHIVFSVISHIDETPSTIFDVLYNRSNKIRFLFTSLDINLSVVVFPLTNILSIFLVPNVVVGFATTSTEDVPIPYLFSGWQPVPKIRWISVVFLLVFGFASSSFLLANLVYHWNISKSFQGILNSLWTRAWFTRNQCSSLSVRQVLAEAQEGRSNSGPSIGRITTGFGLGRLVRCHGIVGRRIYSNTIRGLLRTCFGLSTRHFLLSSPSMFSLLFTLRV